MIEEIVTGARPRSTTSKGIITQYGVGDCIANKKLGTNKQAVYTAKKLHAAATSARSVAPVLVGTTDLIKAIMTATADIQLSM